MFVVVCIASSIVIYVGTQCYTRGSYTRGSYTRRKKGRLVHRLTRTFPSMDRKKQRNLSAQKANQTLALSSFTLGLATVGTLVNPALSAMTIPFVLYIFKPTFQTAYLTVREEKRITTPVLDALRVLVCVGMGYYFAAALNAALQALSHKLLTRGEANLEDSLSRLWKAPDDPIWLFRDGVEVESTFEKVVIGDVLSVGTGETIPVKGKVVSGSGWVDQCRVTGDPQSVRKGVNDTVFSTSTVVSGQLYIETEELPQYTPNQIQEALQLAVETKTIVQKAGEASSDRVSPFMVLAFLAGIPFLGTNRAASFLCTSLGAHMHRLGPLALQNFANLSAQLGILIKDGHALEKLNFVNAIVFDERALSDPTTHSQLRTVIETLRQRNWPAQRISKQPFGIYMLAYRNAHEAKRLADKLGLDDVFVAPEQAQKVAAIAQIQSSGRSVCYIGDGVADVAVMEKAFVSISMRDDVPLIEDAAPLILPFKNLNQLARLFELAATFTTKQGFSLVAPITLDIIDIGTTIFIHFGLAYSLLFNYTGLLLSIVNTSSPLLKYEQFRQRLHTDSRDLRSQERDR